MRKIVAVLAGCLALAGCSGDWAAEVRLKVTEVEVTAVSPIEPPQPRVSLELVGGLPGAYRQDGFSGTSMHPAEIDGDVKVGDEVTCLAKQRSIGILQTNSISTELFQCRKA